MTAVTAPTVHVRVTAVLQKHTGGEKTIKAHGSTVLDLLNDIEGRFPGFKSQMFGADGKLHRFVNVYLNDEDVRVLDGLDTAAKDSDTVVILPAMAGGSR